jgi:hypothetical protein
MSIDDLMRRIEETERLIGVYRNANEVIVGTEDEIYSRRGLINRTTLTAAEIGETIVNILEHRLAAMRAQLEKRHDAKARSWVESANRSGSDFPIQNLPYAVFRQRQSAEAWRAARCCPTAGHG